MAHRSTFAPHAPHPPVANPKRGLTIGRVATHNGSCQVFPVDSGHSRPSTRTAVEPRDRLIAATTTQPASAPAQTVLIVDDNVSSAETLALLIGLSGHATHVAHTGADALEAAERHRPGVILLDIGLPGMDGFEVARQIRRGEDGRRAVLIAVTGFGQDDDRRRTAEAGFNHHLVKPIDLARLEELLNAPADAA